MRITTSELLTEESLARYRIPKGNPETDPSIETDTQRLLAFVSTLTELFFTNRGKTQVMTAMFDVVYMVSILQNRGMSLERILSIIGPEFVNTWDGIVQYEQSHPEDSTQS